MSPWCDDENAVRGGRRFPGDASALAVPGALAPTEGGVPTAFEGPGPAQKASCRAQSRHHVMLPVPGMLLLVCGRPTMPRQTPAVQVGVTLYKQEQVAQVTSQRQPLLCHRGTYLLLEPSADGVGKAGLPALRASSAEDARRKQGWSGRCSQTDYGDAQKAMISGRCRTCAHVLLWRRSLIHCLRLILAALGQHGEVLADLRHLRLPKHESLPGSCSCMCTECF